MPDDTPAPDREQAPLDDRHLRARELRDDARAEVDGALHRPIGRHWTVPIGSVTYALARAAVAIHEADQTILAIASELEPTHERS